MKKNKRQTVGATAVGVWEISLDKKADAIQPRWWHKFMFWKRWNYGEWKVKTEYKKLSEIMDSIAGDDKKN